MSPALRLQSRPGHRARTRWLLFAGLVAATSLAGLAQQQAGGLVVTGARVLDTRAGRYVPSAGLVVRSGRIEAILGASDPLPTGLARLDLKGATLVPGLGDLSSRAVPSGFADADFHYLISLAHGVTMARVIGSPLPWGPSQRNRAADGTLLAPRLWVAGPVLDQSAVGFQVRRVADATAAGRLVSEQAGLRSDWVVVGGGTGVDVLRAVALAGRAAQLRVSAVPGEASMSDIARLDIALIDRLGVPGRRTSDLRSSLSTRADYPKDDPLAAEDYAWALVTDTDIRPVVRLLRAGHTSIVPLLSSFGGTLGGEELKSDAGVAALPSAWRDQILSRAHPAEWPGAGRAAQAARARARLVSALHKAGVGIATGVDPGGDGYTVPGAGVHRELSMLVAAGMSPADAIGAATRECARILGAGGGAGEIRVGSPADFFAVDGDPLRDIQDLRQIRTVVRNGEVLDPKALLAQARRAMRQ